jgi:hypothetical protein
MSASSTISANAKEGIDKINNGDTVVILKNRYVELLLLCLRRRNNNN